MADNPYLMLFHRVNGYGPDAVYTDGLVDTRKIPSGLHVYQTMYGENSFKPALIAHHFGEKCSGTLITKIPLGLEDGRIMHMNGELAISNQTVKWLDFCTGGTFRTTPVSPDKRQLLYTLDRSNDQASGCIGHARFDFGSSGNEHWLKFFPHNQELYTEQARNELGMVLEHLETHELLKTLGNMRSYCYRSPAAKLDEHAYGFVAQTRANTYFLRCMLEAGDYNLYAYMYDSQQHDQYLASQAQTAVSGETQTPQEPQM